MPARRPKPEAKSPIRGRHEGSTYHDRARQRWRGVVELDGQRRFVSGTDEADVRAKLAALRQQHEAGRAPPPESRKLTVGAYLQDWLETKRTLRARAYARLESDVRLILAPALGHLRLSDLRPEHLEKLYVRLHTRGNDHGTGKPLAARTIRTVHRTISQALARAVAHKHLPDNPAAAAESVLPKPPAKPLRALTPAQTAKLLAAARGHRYEHLLTVGSELGCRVGELLGLTWAAVDWAAGTLAVVQQAVPSRVRAPVFDEPKSAAGVRTLYLTAAARRALERQRDAQDRDRLRWQASAKSAWDRCDLVFTTPWGTPLGHSRVARALHRLCAKAGLPPDVSPHWLRHSSATRMLREGVDLVTVSAILGHSDAGFTARTYGHSHEETRRSAAERLDRNRAEVAATAAESTHDAPGRARAG